MDGVVRAMTDDGAFRVITVSTTETVRAAIAAQEAQGTTARHLADLLTGSVLVRETMAPQLRVQGIVKGTGGRGSLVADSRLGGATRGLVQGASEREFTLGPGSRMQVMRTLANGSIQQGVVDVSSAGGLSEALMLYMQTSEQIVSVIAVGNTVDEGAIVRAGGYIVQLLPEAPRAAHAIMTERLNTLDDIETLLSHDDFSAETLARELLHAMPFTVLDQSPLRFECGCSETAVLGALATLGAGDLTELVQAGELLEIRCDYCRAEYQIAPERLRSLIEQS